MAALTPTPHRDQSAASSDAVAPVADTPPARMAASDRDARLRVLVHALARAAAREAGALACPDRPDRQEPTR